MLKSVFFKLISFLFIIENIFSRINDYSTIESITTNENILADCVPSIHFPSNFINSEIVNNEVIINFCTKTSFLENGLFFYLNKSSNYQIPMKNSITNESLLYDQNLNTVKLKSSILYSFSNSSEKINLTCLIDTNFTFNGVEFSLLMNECNDFLKENRGENIFLKISIFDFPIPENAYKYELLIHLENYENKKYIHIIHYSFVKIFAKDDIIISLDKDNECGKLTTYYVKILTDNILFDNYDDIFIRIVLPFEKYSTPTKSLIDYFRTGNTEMKTFENKEINRMSNDTIVYKLKYQKSDFIEFSIDNIWAPIFNDCLNGMKILIQLPPYEDNMIIATTSDPITLNKNDNYMFLIFYYLECDCHAADISKYSITSTLVDTVTEIKITLKIFSYFPTNLFIEINFPFEMDITNSSLTGSNSMFRTSFPNKSTYNITSLIKYDSKENKSIEMKFSNVQLPKRRGVDTIKINYYFWEKNKLVNVYSNNEHILNIFAPILNADIEFNYYIDYIEVKFIITAGMIINESCYFLLSLPNNTKFYSLKESICSEKNDHNLLCSTYDYDDKKNDIIKISNLKRKNINEEYQFYIKLLPNFDYMYQDEYDFNIIELYNNKNEKSYYNEDKITIISKVNKPKFFNSNISTKNTFESNLYTFESEINSELDINGKLFFKFSEIYHNISKNDINISFYINNEKCTNFKYNLDLPYSLLINDFSNCFNEQIISSNSIKFLVNIQDLMSPRITKEIKIDYFYADSNKKIIEYSNDKIEIENKKIIKNLNITPNSLNTYVLTKYEFIFTNENYINKNDILVISTDYKFFNDETDELISSESKSKPSNDFLSFLTTDIIKDQKTKKTTYKLFLKINESFENNKEIKFTLNNIQNPHSQREINFKLEIYDYYIKNIIQESNLFPINFISEITLSNLLVTRISKDIFNIKLSPTKIIEAYDTFEIKYNNTSFGLKTSGKYCQIKIIKNVNHEFGCMNNIDNGNILLPWGYKSLKGIIDSSFEIEFNLLNIVFKHTEGIDQNYKFEFNILDKDLNIKEKGNFNFTIQYDCYYTCEKCDENNKTFCITCNDDYPYINDLNGECFNGCFNGSHLNYKTGFCYKCNPNSNCLECDKDDINKCIRCPSDYPILINDTCHQFCPIGEFKLNGSCTNIEEYIEKNIPELEEGNKENNNIQNKNKNNISNNRNDNNDGRNNNYIYYNLHLNYEVNKVRGYLQSLRLSNNDDFPFDYYVIPISIIIIIGVNFFILWRKGIEFYFTGYILLELSILFKLILISLYILTFMTGEKILFYGYSIILTFQYFISLLFFFIYDFIYGMKTSLFSRIISIIFDYKILKIDLKKKLNKRIKFLTNKFIYIVYSIYICDIVFTYFSTILFGIYLTFVIKDFKYIYNLIQYSIFLSIIIFYFFSLDIIIPKENKKLIINKLNIPKIPLNEFTTLKSQMTSTDRFRVDTNLQHPNEINNVKIYSNNKND